MRPAADERPTIQRWSLLAILIVAALARLCWLTEVPPPLNQDEAARGYDAWCLLETGTDRHGEAWPFFLQSFGPGDCPGALSTYLIVPFVSLLGPTTLAMRLPTALAGLATVWLMYGLVRRWWGAKAALIAAAILAVDPWHVSMTRTALELGIAPLCLVAALLAWTVAGLWPKPAETVDAAPMRPNTAFLWSLVGGLLMGFHAWAYSATRLFTALFLAGALCLGVKYFIALTRHPLGRARLVGAILGLAIGTVPLWWTAIRQPESLAARVRVTLLLAQWPVSQIALEILRNFARNLDPRYLFWQCEDVSRSTIPHVGQHLLFVLPLFAVGWIQVFKNLWRSVWARWILLWFLVSIVPAAICRDWNPHPGRTVAGLPLYPILASLGAIRIIACLQRCRDTVRRTMAGVAISCAAVNLAHAANMYYWRFPIRAETDYQTPLYKAFQLVSRYSHQADFVLVSHFANQSYVYALLCEPIPPRAFQSIPKVILPGPLGFHQALRVGKYYFAPHDFARSPQLVARFQEMIAALPPSSRGLVIERRGHFKGGEVLAVIPAGDGSCPDEDYEIRWWRPGDVRP